jgi:hypothetical protein
MIVATLQADLLATFLAMNDMLDGGGDAYCAEKMAKAIKNYALTGQTATTDSGTAPVGSYTGAGVGTMTIDDDRLKTYLQATFEAAYNDDDLATHMARDIDTVCKASDTVQEISTGTVTTPAGVSSSFSGPAVGKFTGDKSKIENPLKSCFASMRSMMTGGGNELYASMMAIAMDNYFKTGTINVTLKVPPFASGSGKGAIA